MDVRDLNKWELAELKETYVCETMDAPGWGDLADAQLIPDSVIFEHFAGFNFGPGDFWCDAGGDWRGEGWYTVDDPDAEPGRAVWWASEWQLSEVARAVPGAWIHYRGDGDAPEGAEVDAEAMAGLI